MLKKQTTLVMAAAAALLMTMAGAAWAQRGPVADACDREIQRYCANTPHGGGAVRACLQRHRGALSRHCKAALDGTGWGRRWR